MKILEFVNACLDRGRWPPAIGDLPDSIELSDHILQAMGASLIASSKDGNEKGFGINYDNDSEELVKGPDVSGKCTSIVIPQPGTPTQAPIGVFHTHFGGEDEGVFSGIENPPSMADILHLSQPGRPLSLVITGKPDKPVYYLMVATVEYGVEAQRWTRSIGKGNLEFASEQFIAEEHRKLVMQHQVDMVKAMRKAVRKDFSTSVDMLKFGAYRGKTAALARFGV